MKPFISLIVTAILGVHEAKAAEVVLPLPHEIVIEGHMTFEGLQPTIDKLQAGTENDIFYISINSPGGEADTGFALAHAMRSNKSREVCEIKGLAASAAAVTLLGCDSIITDADDVIMFHTPYYLIDDEPVRTAKLNGEYLPRFITLRFDILTGDEWFKFVQGGDVYMSGDVFKVRFNNWKQAVGF